jgi:hypothetical protein
MPVLLESLQGRDLGHMRIIAELWGINLEAPDERVARLELVRSLMDAELIEEVVESLPLVARRALEDLVRSEGRMPWAQYIRRYGELREMGPGKRDRERPHLTPVSPVEMLWYRGFVGRAFFDTPGGPEEFAYIPDDLFGLLSGAHELQALPLGRPASPLERLHTFPVDDIILDHACTQLAALRVGIVPSELLASPPGTRYPLNAPVLDALLRTVGLLDEVGLPQPERTREFLETGRAEALAVLVTAWMESRDFNELRLIPELSSEGEWHNDPLLARKSVLEMLSTIPADTWWSLEGFVQDVHNEHPDFQRPAGDYDSWFIRHVQSGDFLRGFEAWDDVDGALLRFLITGPMHWLGIYDLAAPEMQASPTAFKRSRWASTLLSGQAPDGLPREEEKLKVTSDGRIRAARLVPRAVRYQIARFAEWEGERAGDYSYRLTPSALERAIRAGLTVGHLQALLRRYTEAVPPSLVKALERWEERGRSDATIERMLVLRTSSPEVLEALRKSRAARFLGDQLGPAAVVVNAGAAEKVLAILAELGYLGEAHLEF